MKSRVLTIVLGCALLSCERVDQSPQPQPQSAAVPDLDGLPDLIVDSHMLDASWVVYEETFAANGCTAIEGGFPGGTYRTLRFSVSTPNIGDADVVIGDPNVHIDPNGDGDASDSDGLYEFAECHAHYHFRNYATYEILPLNADGSLGQAVQAKKRGFCMIDTTPWKATESPRARVYDRCGTRTSAGNQGISTGWADQYFKWLSGQFFLLNDPVEPIAPGKYVIRITVNPPFASSKKQQCPAKDSAGLCHMFAESNYNNNVGQAVVTIPAGRPGKTGYGPGGGQEVQPEAHKY
jgi:hypothetical protein